MKNKIIIFQGQISTSFFLNEIDYIKQNFEIEAIFFYNDNKFNVNDTIKKKGLNSNICYNSSLHFFDYIKALFSKKTIEFYDEIKHLNGKHLFSKLMYVFYYYAYAKKIYSILKRKKSTNENLCLYSFWLSRNAYAMYYVNKYIYDGNAKMCSRAHGYDLYEDRNKINYLPFRKLFAENIDLISFISNNGMTYFTNKYIVKNRTIVHYLGSFNIKNIHKQIRKKDYVCILSCSSIIRIKRLDLIIDLLSGLSDLKIKWIHFGNGELREEIEKYASEKLSNSSVEYFFKGHIDNSQILSEMEQEDVDFLINMSDSEGLPVSMMEALSFGLPIVARNVGGVNEIVNDRTGLLCDNIQDLSTIRDYLLNRLKFPENYFMISRGCIDFWEKNFSGDKNYNLFFCKELNNLINK